MPKGYCELTSESVAAGHPDKLCDQISDGVLDEVLRQDPMGRVACETLATSQLIMVSGELTTKADIDVKKIVHDVLHDVGYTDSRFGVTAQTCTILNTIGRQSPDIAQGVDKGGAGDQGMMIGFACRETPELMPLPITLAHRLMRRQKEARERGILKYLGPDAKSQVTVCYLDGKPLKVTTVVLSTQHTDDILDKSGRQITEKARKEISEAVIEPVLGPRLMDSKTRILINPTGKFIVGGPAGDTGLTGRKIIVDTYGGIAPHGGGAFSGKDPTKVDRSAAYMARYIAKNIVAAKLAERAFVTLAYAIGVAEPVSVHIDFQGTQTTGADEENVSQAVRKVFSLTPQGIIAHFKLRRPIFRATAAYGHFGRSEFPWEETDKADQLLAALNIKARTTNHKAARPCCAAGVCS
ncbi:MAG: methionine adenosyltransferase [Elusimicrobia bacterium]|nr:methionine adenosyltransferase [Elusimicrobiota bacterium]